MSIRVYIQEGDKEQQVTGGCYGCIGRADGYTPNPEVIDAVREYQGKSVGFSDTLHSDSGLDNPDYVILRDPKGDGETFQNEYIFQPEAHEWYEFLYNAEEFGIGLPNPSCLEQGEIKVDADIPADDLIQTLFLLRAPSDYMKCHQVYSILKETDLPDIAKLIFSLGMHPLATGTTGNPFNLNRHDGTMFAGLPVKDFQAICNGRPPSCAPFTYKEANVYPMTVLSRWGGKIERSFDYKINQYWAQQKFFPLSRIRGHFLDLPQCRTLGDPETVRDIVLQTYNWLMEK